LPLELSVVAALPPAPVLSLCAIVALAAPAPIREITIPKENLFMLFPPDTATKNALLQRRNEVMSLDINEFSGS
jgi:hypothetical protein